MKEKTLYLIGGPMGVGKTTVCEILKERLAPCAFLDGDWCWNMSPFLVTEETKRMVQDNIGYLLSGFLRCSVPENIVFCWVMHQQAILDGLLARLDTSQCRVKTISLVCGEEALKARLQKDIDCGKRRPDVLARSLSRLPLYSAMNTVKIDVTNLTPEQTAEEILRL